MLPNRTMVSVSASNAAAVAVVPGVAGLVQAPPGALPEVPGQRAFTARLNCTGLSRSLVDNPCYLSVASAHVNRVAAGALLELGRRRVCGHRHLAYPVSRRWSAGLVLVTRLPGLPVRFLLKGSGRPAGDRVLRPSGAHQAHQGLRSSASTEHDYGVEPITDRCEFSRARARTAQAPLPGRNRTLGPSTAADARAFTQRPHA